MSSSNPILTTYEAALKFSQDMAARINKAAAETAGVDVMWFRAKPDMRNQDVIFQSYTLYGVEDCPLNIKALYTDTGYDDAGLAYNIMGIEYTIPLTLEIPVLLWYEATGYDGTIPQRGDIVFIPLSSKLLEVVSMTPVKAVAAQTTSFKMNCSVYKPSRNRIVSENLKTSIEENTVNLEKIFGKDIETEMKDIVDSPQTSIYTSTNKDESKILTKTDNPDESSIIKKQYLIKSEEIKSDGHVIARSYYDMSKGNGISIRYPKSSDHIEESETRCISVWFRYHYHHQKKNIKSMSAIPGRNECSFTLSGIGGFEIGDRILVERGEFVIYGTVISKSPTCVEFVKRDIEKMNSFSDSWFMLPGYTIRKAESFEIIHANGENDFSISISGGTSLIIQIDGDETVIHSGIENYPNVWYGIVANIGEKSSFYMYSSGKISELCSIEGLKTKGWKELSLENGYYIQSSDFDITNIRVYSEGNFEKDSRISDMVSYTIRNNSKAIVNDSADVWLDKQYISEQK